MAYWDPRVELCNWISRLTDGVADPAGAITPASAAGGPDLYMGSAGIALFLAELNAVIGDDEFRGMSQGAIARSIRQLERRTWGNPCLRCLSLAATWVWPTWPGGWGT